MKYINLIFAVVVGFLWPALLFNIGIKFGLIPSGEGAESIPQNFREYYFGGALWVLAGAVPFAIAALFMDSKHVMTTPALWLPAYIPLLYSCGVIFIFFG